jgi:hypothetical protein
VIVPLSSVAAMDSVGDGLPVATPGVIVTFLPSSEALLSTVKLGAVEDPPSTTSEPLAMAVPSELVAVTPQTTVCVSVDAGIS